MSPSAAHPQTAAVSARTLSPLIKIVFVRAPVEKAFHRFTAELGTWWPLASHSVGESAAESVTMEGRVGGRIVERMKNGDTSVWGTLTAWDPPRRVAFPWHPGHENDHPASSRSRSTLMSTSRSTYFHSSVARSVTTSSSNASACAGSNSNQVRKSKGSPRSRQ